MKNLQGVLRNSRLAEVSSLGKIIVAIYGDYTLDEDTYLVSLLTDINTTQVTLSDAINRNVIVSQLKNDDNERDEHSEDLFGLTEGYTHYPTSIVRMAAKMVKSVLNKYSLQLTRESYELESGIIDSLLGDLSKADIKEAIDHLPGVEQIITNLAEAEKHFTESLVANKRYKVEFSNLKKAAVLKGDLMSLINDKLIVHINAMKNTKPEIYGEFSEVLAQTIDDHNMGVRRRRQQK